MRVHHLTATIAITLGTAAFALFHSNVALARRPTPEAGVDPAATDASKRDPAALHEARGKIQEVDKAGNQLTVEQANQQSLTLKLDKTTTIFVDGRTATLDEIGAGQEVRASFEAKQGTNRAQWVEVSKKAKKPSMTRETLPDAPTAAPR